MTPTFDLNTLVRPNIAALRPYSSARDEFKGQAEVYLDANENPFETGLNRYPDPLAAAVKAELESIKGISPQQMMLGNGSDEVIDLLFRIFCEPGQDEVIILPPTYGMYQVSADINNVAVKKVPLKSGFVPDVDAILAAVTERTKILWLCTPNNPSGNDFPASAIEQLVSQFPGIVVIDEAYVDFSGRPSYSTWLERFPNLVIMQTFSKAWGMAGIRLGMAFAAEAIINLLNAVKPPYNVNRLSQKAALDALQQKDKQAKQIQTILGQRTLVQQYLAGLDFIERIYPSSSNFILAKVTNPKGIYKYLMDRGIIVRDRSSQLGCESCLRFTVGTPEENERLFRALLEMNEL